MKAVLLAAALALAACSTSGSSNTIPGSSGGGTRGGLDLLGSAPGFKLTLSLFDAPLANAPGVKVNVGLDGAQLLTASGAVPFVTNKQPQVVNLIDLQDHSFDLEGTAPAGTYTGIRLLIDSAHSGVVIGGRTIPIVWGAPGNPTTAAVIAVDFACAFSLGSSGSNGDHAKITLDFNVMQSVRFVNGTIYVEPSVTAANAAGQVSGKVKNAAGKAVSSATVLAVDGTGRTVNSTATKADGSFTLHALPPGTYTIAVKNSYVTAPGETIVAAGADPGAAPSQTVVISPEDQLDLGTLLD